MKTTWEPGVFAFLSSLLHLGAGEGLFGGCLEGAHCIRSCIPCWLLPVKAESTSSLPYTQVILPLLIQVSKVLGEQYSNASANCLFLLTVVPQEHKIGEVKLNIHPCSRGEEEPRKALCLGPLFSCWSHAGPGHEGFHSGPPRLDSDISQQLQQSLAHAHGLPGWEPGSALPELW